MGHISCPAQSLSHRRGQVERNISAVRTSDRVCLPARSDGAAPEDKEKVVHTLDSPLKKHPLKSQRGIAANVCMPVHVYLVQHGSGVCCRQTEASSGLCDRRGWKADYHYTNFPLQHFSSKSPGQHQKTETTISFYA